MGEALGKDFAEEMFDLSQVFFNRKVSNSIAERGENVSTGVEEGVE